MSARLKQERFQTVLRWISGMRKLISPKTQTMPFIVLRHLCLHVLCRGRMLKDFNAEGSEVFIFMLSTRAGMLSWAALHLCHAHGCNASKCAG